MNESAHHRPRGGRRRQRWLLAVLALFGLWVWADQGSGESQVQLRISSVPGGVVSSSVYHPAGSRVSVPAAPAASGSYRFTHWQLNGSRQQDAFGISVNAFTFTILENSEAVAHYLLESEDADADQIPDWYEWVHYGSLSQDPDADTDGDGVSLIDEYRLGTQPRIPDSAADGGIVEGGVSRRRGERIAVVVGPDYHRYTESSLPPGVVSRAEYVRRGTTVATANLGGEHLGHRFTQWTINGVRQESPSGVALNQVTFTLQSDTAAVAEYLPVAQDADADGIPDWFEMNQYGSINVNPGDDTDGDGRSLAEEWSSGTQPRIPDSASDGSVVEGGVSRRRGEKLALVFSDDYVRYTEFSDPGGAVARDTHLTIGTTVSTANAPTDMHGYKFGQWTLNGVRQESPAGIAKSQVTFTLSEETVAVATYIPATRDLDADQIPDWYEIQQFGTLDQDAQSDSDNDGVGLLEEYLRGTQPRIHDSAADGGIVEGGVSRRRGEKMVLNLQFFPAGQIAGDGGGGLFSDPYAGGSGSLVMPGGSSAPALGDLDGDGDLDLIVGGTGGRVKWMINEGSPFAPQYRDRSAGISGLADWPTGSVYPALADWTGDGRADLVVGSDDGRLRFYESQSGAAIAFTWVGSWSAGSAAVHPGFLPGSLDLLVLDGATGRVARYPRGSGSPPYAAPAVDADVLSESVIDGTAISVSDVGGDGRLDVLVSDRSGRIWRFNGQADGSYILASKVWGGSFNGFRDGLTMALADVDGDGDVDIVGGGTDGTLIYLTNPAKHLRISPVVATLGVGESLDLSSIDDDGTLVWSLAASRSGATINAQTGMYHAGETAGIDQISVRNAAGRTGTAWINVVRRGGVVGGVWRALLVDGRRGPNDPVWPAADALNSRALEVLRYRGLGAADIQWLGHGAQAGARPTREALRNILRDGAGVPTDTDRLLISLVDHGRIASDGDGLFLLSESESVSGSELDAWLDGLQQSRPGLEVVVLVESCYGGRVAAAMAAPDAYADRRWVVSSSGADELAHLAAGGWVSYTNLWWSAVAAGKSMAEAHDDAAAAMSGLQSAWRGSGGSTLAATSVGLSGVAVSGRPQVSVSHPLIELQGTQEARIAVSAQSSFGIQQVWGVVIPPGYRSTGDAPVVDLPQVMLARESSTGEWAAQVGGFSEGGAPYTILVQARDSWGQVSAPMTVQVIQSSVRNRVIILAHGEDNWAGADVAGSLARYTREVALLRRVREEDVKVLADPVFGIDDVAGGAGVESLREAVLGWANADDRLAALTVFAVGQGSTDGMVCSNGEVVTPADLRSWLDELQDASGATVQLIVDSDYSGRFLNGSSGRHRRIVVTTTDANQRNTFATGRWTGVSRWMLNAIARGRDLRESYQEAQDFARMLGQALPALFDDDGDGTFIKQRDGFRAINAFVGSAYVTADDPPFIGSASAAMQVNTGGAARFWVGGILMPDGESPDAVWYEVIGPDGTSRGTGTMWRNLTKDRYDGAFGGFSEPGRYLIFAQAGTPDDPARTTPPAVIRIDFSVNDDAGGPATDDLPALQLRTDGTPMEVESDAGGRWRMALLQGQRVVVEAYQVSAGRDVQLELIGGGGRVLASADQWGSGFGESIDGWEAPADGNYLVVAKFASSGSAAECSVRAFIKRDAGTRSTAAVPGQSIDFSIPSVHALDQGPLALTVTASSGLPVRIEVASGPAIIDGTSLLPQSVGLITLVAYQDGDDVWESAMPVTRTLQITGDVANTYDDWAQTWFENDPLGLGAPDRDADGDGFTNRAEWLAGTHPLDADDRLQVLEARRDHAGFRIRWHARQGIRYRVTSSADLIEWTELSGSRATGIGEEAEVIDPASQQEKRFYRVEVVE